MIDTTDTVEPQVMASRPRESVFVAANAGSGKTSTLVKRVARLLLDGARPEAVLCVTYTKAGAAEMQRRLFQDLGEWAVAKDEDLTKALVGIDEAHRPLSKARALFARALETPGGLKIQTIHAFCEKLLRRFPLEAGVSPGFTVLEDAAAAEVSRRARDRVAELATLDPDGPVGQAYAHFSVQLDWAAFNTLFAEFEAKRSAIAAYVGSRERMGGYMLALWRALGFALVESSAAITTEAVSFTHWAVWKRAAAALDLGAGKTDQTLAASLRAVGPHSEFRDLWSVFSTQVGAPRAKLGTNSVDAQTRQWLIDEQARLGQVAERLKAARIAEDSVFALTLAQAYGGAYAAAKAGRGALDFGDLIDLSRSLLTERLDAAWVLYKLDGGLDHILLDEAQDTAPDQWDILRALSAEFFAGLGAGRPNRTLFAVGDEKQSIFSFQGARPERLAVETQAFERMAEAAQAGFGQVKLLESWRSTPEILSFVDLVFRPLEALRGLLPGVGENVQPFPIKHTPKRDPAGCVELWPLEVPLVGDEPDVWAPVDSEPATGAGKRLATRIARSIAAMIARGDAVLDRETRQMRSCGAGDVLILVRRRQVLFEEIIRALKHEGVPVAGADRLKLSTHGVFADLIALARFACFPPDDLNLAGVLRGPFCDIDEESLFDLAWARPGRLWSELLKRAAERDPWRAAVDLLNWTRTEASRLAPFDFYSRFLGRLDRQGLSMRRRLLTRMGVEGEEALDAFLAQTLVAERRGQRDLETFIAAMAASEIEIKREPEQAADRGGGKVRVMTVHGAKGLEAPIVILPDTTSRATPIGGRLLEADDGAFLWAPRRPDDCPASAAAWMALQSAIWDESSRLLYVALTRARDRLIVCGVAMKQARAFERSWYDYVSRAFDEAPNHAFSLEGGGEGRRYGVDPAPAPGDLIKDAGEIVPPAWTGMLAPVAAAMASYASPTSLADAAKGPAPSPLAEIHGLGRYRRGDLIHRLLERLPDLEPGRWAEAARRLLLKETDINDDQRAEMAAAALGVLGDPVFADVFGPGSRAEVALAGGAAALPEGLVISGRIDRLVVRPDRVLVIDFKTNRPAPGRIEDADAAYITQMAVYAAVLAEIYPGRSIEAGLVWTDGPSLMPVPSAMIARALEDLAVKA